MASLNGITLTPDTGTGTKSLSISAGAYQGRENRSTKFTAANSSLGITSSNSLVVTQQGVERFNVQSRNIGSDVTSVTLTGTSNLQQIRATGDGLWNYLSTATINGTQVTKSQLTSGYTVEPNDPGKSDVYNVSFTFTGIPESVSSVTYNGYINGSQTTKLTVTKTGTGTRDIWFSSTQSGSKTTDNVTVTLNADGQVTQGIAYVRTDPSDLSWTITASNN